MVEIAYATLGLLDERGDLGSLESDRGAFRVMLVVDIGEVARVDEAAEFVSQRDDALLGVAALGGEPLGYLRTFRCHTPCNERSP